MEGAARSTLRLFPGYFCCCCSLHLCLTNKVFEFSSGMCRQAVGGTVDRFVKEAKFSVGINK